MILSNLQRKPKRCGSVQSLSKSRPTSVTFFFFKSGNTPSYGFFFKSLPRNSCSGDKVYRTKSTWDSVLPWHSFFFLVWLIVWQDSNYSLEVKTEPGFLTFVTFIDHRSINHRSIWRGKKIILDKIKETHGTGICNLCHINTGKPFYLLEWF